MNHLTPGADVVRGVHVETVPVRLPRGPRNVDPTPTAPTRASIEEEARQCGHAEGLQQGRAEGLRAGYAEGFRQAQADAASEARAALDAAIAEAVAPVHEEQSRLRGLGAALGGSMRECLAAAEEEMVALCFETICHVLGTVAVHPETIRRHLSQLTDTVVGNQPVAMHVHPDDALLMQRSGVGDDARTLRWVPDPDVAIGGCVIVRAGGGIDARLETMLEACKAALLAARERAAGESLA